MTVGDLSTTAKSGQPRMARDGPLDGTVAAPHFGFETMPESDGPVHSGSSLATNSAKSNDMRTNPLMDPSAGGVLGGSYRLTKTIGEGAYGVV